MISQYLGFDSDYIIIGLAALVFILIILMIINVVQMSKLKKSYKIFMKGKNAKNRRSQSSACQKMPYTEAGAFPKEAVCLRKQ